jgi:hypothetical protein
VSEQRNGRIPDETRRAILATLRAGTSVGETAKLHRVSKGSVSNIARAAGLSLERSPVKNASQARVHYAQARRLELSDKLFGKIEALLDRDLAPQQLQPLVMAFAVLTDKRRLEEGEVTERHAHRDERAASLERGRERLRLLHERAGS